MCLKNKYSQFISAQQGKRICFEFIILLLCCANLDALENNGRGTKAIGMANAFVAVSDNLWAINYNPAGLVQLTNIQFAAFVVPEQFGLSELRTTAIAAVIPLSLATLGFKAEKFGSNLYMETEYGMACAAYLDQNISFGLNVNIDRIDIYNYGSEQNILIDIGILTQLSEIIKIGFSFNNVTRASIGKQGDRFPQLCTLGACWMPINDLQLSFEIEKDVRFPASIKAGVEKTIFHVFAIRAGVADNPDKYSAGVGVKYSNFEFGYAGYSHYDLGWTHQIELSFRIER
jgi:hypothetical protein